MVSNKITWFRKLCDETAHEQRLLDFARKDCKGGMVLPKDHGGKGANRNKYLRHLDDCKAQVERERRKQK